MGDLVTYDEFKEAWRKRKYGDSFKKLQAMNFSPDYNPFEHDREAEPEYGEDTNTV